MGIEDLNRVYKINELATGHVMFCATGVTQGSFLDGVRFTSGGATTISVVMRSESARFVIFKRNIILIENPGIN